MNGVAVDAHQMNLFLLGKKAVGEQGRLPWNIMQEVVSGEESCLVVLIVDIVTIKVPHHFGVTGSIDFVDDLLLGRGERVESCKNDHLVLDLRHQFAIGQFCKLSGDHAIVAFPLLVQTLAKPVIIALQILKKQQVLLLFGRDAAIEVPGAKPFQVVDVGKQMLGVDLVLVNLIEVLGHLCGHAPEHADAIASLVQFRVDGDELEQHVDRVNQPNSAPLGHGFLDREHLW